MSKPIIGITCRQDSATLKQYFRHEYSNAILKNGGIPIIIPLIDSMEYLTTLTDSIHGICLSGAGNDIDPKYFHQPPHPKIGIIDPLREAVDFKLLKIAEARHLPLLGICYGCQAINVFRSGSLLQDIPSLCPEALRHHDIKDALPARHQIQISGPLKEWRHCNQAEVNSHHHQAIDRIGDNLIPIAKSNDGMIEAIWSTRPKQWLLGVQWHPELDWETSKVSQSVFSNFIEAATRFMAESKFQKSQPSIQETAPT